MGAAHLAEAGLLDGRMATTHWAAADRLAVRYPRVDWRPDLFMTEDSRLLCSGGVYAAIDVSLYLVEKLCGRTVAAECARALLLPMPRVHQSGYAVAPVSRPHEDAAIRAAEGFLHAHFADPVSTRTLARVAGLAGRTFVRRFRAATGRLPGEYLQSLRIQAAKAMLERDTKPIQTISAEVGYADVTFFRAVFKRATGMTPAEHRARFAGLSIPQEVRLEGGPAGPLCRDALRRDDLTAITGAPRARGRPRHGTSPA